MLDRMESGGRPGAISGHLRPLLTFHHYPLQHICLSDDVLIGSKLMIIWFLGRIQFEFDVAFVFELGSGGRYLFEGEYGH